MHTYRPYAGGVASGLATSVYVATVTQILYDNSYSKMTQISNMKVIDLMVDFKQIVKLWPLSMEFCGDRQLFAAHHRTQYLTVKV